MNICKWWYWKKILIEEICRLILSCVILILCICLGISNPTAFIKIKLKQLMDKTEAYPPIANEENTRKRVPPHLHNEMIEFYRDIADRQFNAGNYKNALGNYQEILDISPQDEAAKMQINEIMNIQKTRR